MNRLEHLAWCKERALKELAAGTPANALASMGSDLDKHEDTRNHVGIRLGLILMMAGKLDSKPEMEQFINGFR